MSGANIQLNVSETTTVQTPPPVVQVKRAVDSQPCNWHIEPTEDGIIATNGQEKFEGTVEEFNAYLKG